MEYILLYQSRRVVQSHKPRSSRQSDTTGIVVIIIQNNNGGGCGGDVGVGAGRVGGQWSCSLGCWGLQPQVVVILLVLV